MSHGLTPASPRILPAKQFGMELRRTLKARKVSQSETGRDLGFGRASVRGWLTGLHLPRLETAVRVAEYLDNDRLAEIVRKARTITCVNCGHQGINESTGDKKYCDDCAPIADRLAISAHKLAHRRQANQPSRAIKALKAGDPEMILRDQRAVRARLGIYQAAAAAFCDDCEPEGICRTPACPLRPVSPLPLASRSLRQSA